MVRVRVTSPTPNPKQMFITVQAEPLDARKGRRASKVRGRGRARARARVALDARP